MSHPQLIKQCQRESGIVETNNEENTFFVVAFLLKSLILLKECYKPISEQGMSYDRLKFVSTSGKTPPKMPTIYR